MTPEERFTKIAQASLVGRTITNVQYMSHQDAQNSLWDRRPLLIQLDNGDILVPQSDDEGNDAGALFLDTDDNERSALFPVLFAEISPHE